MAVELLSGYRNSGFKMEDNAVQEAAAAGLQSVEKLIRLLSQSQQQNTGFSSGSLPPAAAKVGEGSADYQAVADVAVSKFKKFISLLDRTRTGHARFRRGPICNPPAAEKKMDQELEPVASGQTRVIENSEKPHTGGSKMYSPSPIQRLPPLPHNHHQLLKNGPAAPPPDRKESSTTINFSASPATSSPGSFISSLTGDTESLQPSLSSGFQITNLSNVSSAGRPPLSTSSFKRKCNSMDDSSLKCGSAGGSASGRCHCPKKR